MPKLLELMERLRARRRLPESGRSDPTAYWTARDWADLPVHHPRDDRR